MQIWKNIHLLSLIHLLKSDLSQIQWIFDGQKTTQGIVTDAIQNELKNWDVSSIVKKNGNVEDEKKIL